MRAAKLASVLLLALTGGASASLNATECGVLGAAIKCLVARNEEQCDTSICTFTAGTPITCVANAATTADLQSIGTSTRAVEVGATGDAACAATTDCDITTTNKLTNYQADGTSSLMGVNKCREEDDGTCALSFPTGYVDDCISSGFLSSDYESVSGANFVAPTVAAVLFSASLLIFD